MVDKKRINEALDKHLLNLSPSISKGFNSNVEFNGKDSLSTNTATNSVISAATGGYPGGKKPSDMPSVSVLDVTCSDETDSEEFDDSGSEGDDTSWISWFLNLRGNEFFCEVDYNYILDDFNLCGLNSQVPYYDYALDLILDPESSNSSYSEMFSEEQNEFIKFAAAAMLYGLIHARYILTSKGMAAMLEKYKSSDFGRCPRAYCRAQPCLPVGPSDLPRSSTVKIFCPNCEDIYYPRSKCTGKGDGAYFGTTFPHLFLMTYPHIKPEKPNKMHGFGVYKFGNGHQYEGSWHEGKHQGFGLYTFKNGEAQSGYWQNGFLHNASNSRPCPAQVSDVVRKAREAAQRSYSLTVADDRVREAVKAANRAANAARVAAVKAVQQRFVEGVDSGNIIFDVC